MNEEKYRRGSDGHIRDMQERADHLIVMLDETLLLLKDLFHERDKDSYAGDAFHEAHQTLSDNLADKMDEAREYVENL